MFEINFIKEIAEQNTLAADVQQYVEHFNNLWRQSSIKTLQLGEEYSVYEKKSGKNN